MKVSIELGIQDASCWRKESKTVKKSIKRIFLALLYFQNIRLAGYYHKPDETIRKDSWMLICAAECGCSQGEVKRLEYQETKLEDVISLSYVVNLMFHSLVNESLLLLPSDCHACKDIDTWSQGDIVRRWPGTISSTFDPHLAVVNGRIHLKCDIDDMFMITYLNWSRNSFVPSMTA